MLLIILYINSLRPSVCLWRSFWGVGEAGVPVKQRATSLLSATAPPAPPLPFPRCKCYGSSCWMVQATTRSAAARGSGWNSHGWRTRLGSKMDLRMPHLVDIAPFCSVVQAPSSPSSLNESFLIVLFLQRASQQCFVFAIPNEIFATSIPSREI